jgi:hypothetical protein
MNVLPARRESTYILFRLIRSYIKKKKKIKEEGGKREVVRIKIYTILYVNIKQRERLRKKLLLEILESTTVRIVCMYVCMCMFVCTYVYICICIIHRAINIASQHRSS